MNEQLRADNAASSAALQASEDPAAGTIAPSPAVKSVLALLGRVEPCAACTTPNARYFWYARWSVEHPSVQTSVQMAQLRHTWAALGAMPGSNSYTPVIANGRSALLDTRDRGGRAWLDGPGVDPTVVVIARLDRGSWTPRECSEMAERNITIFSGDLGQMLSPADPLVQRMFGLSSTMRQLHGTYMNFWRALEAQ